MTSAKTPRKFLSSQRGEGEKEGKGGYRCIGRVTTSNMSQGRNHRVTLRFADGSKDRLTHVDLILHQVVNQTPEDGRPTAVTGNSSICCCDKTNDDDRTLIFIGEFC